MGLSFSNCKKPNRGGQSRVSSFQAAILSREGGAVYTAVDEPNFLRPYRDPKSVDDNVDFPLDVRLLDSVADEELVALFDRAPRLHEISTIKIVRISKVTRPQGDESEDGHFIVMDYIAGHTVEESWYSLEQDAREAATRQVADMIETMQSHRLNDLPPGPIGSPTEKCQGPWFTDYGAGLFATIQELQDWFNHKIDICIKVFQLPANYPRFHFRDLVFTHQDIATRNVVVDAVGKVWLVDWGCAGAYPVGFEQAAFREQDTNSSFLEMVLSKLSDRHNELARRKAAIAYGLSTGRHL